MKIAVISYSGLPDARVEKEIHSLIKNHEVVFIGPFKGTSGIFGDLDLKKIVIPTPPWRGLVKLKIEPYYSLFKRKIKKILEKVRPDLILSINIFSAMIVYDLGYPMVYDDHEFLSEQLKYVVPLTYKQKLILKRLMKISKVYEEKISSKYPIIVVSNNMKKLYIQKYKVSVNNISVIKNYPSMNEVRFVSELKLAPGEKNVRKLIYIGKDILEPSRKARLLFKDLSVFKKIFLEHVIPRYKHKIILYVIGLKDSPYDSIIPLGWVKHMEIYIHLVKTEFGFAAFKPSKFHEVINPNKIYHYAISGCIPIITSSMTEIQDELNSLNLPFITVNSKSYEESLKEVLYNIIQATPDEIMDKRHKLLQKSKKHFIWEKQEKKFLTIIKNA